MWPVLPGIPKKVTDRADIILAESLSRDTSGEGRRPGATPSSFLPMTACLHKIGCWCRDPAIVELSRLDPDTMTPLQALAKLAELKDLTRKPDGTDFKEAGR